MDCLLTSGVRPLSAMGRDVVKLLHCAPCRILHRPASILVLAGCGQAWNDPYPGANAEQNILYDAFTDRPKHLNPAQSYTEDEMTFTAQDPPPLHITI